MLPILTVLASSLLLVTVADETFLDPTGADFKKCGLDQVSTLCDPDHVLTETTRKRLDNVLKSMEPRTSLRKRGEKKGNCTRSGITPAVYLVRNGDEERVEALTAFMKSNWTVDAACENVLFIILSANETQYHVYRNPEAPNLTPLSPYDVAHYINREVTALTSGRIGQALDSVLQKTLARAAGKYPKWKRTGFPNPMRGEFKKCGLKAAGPLCDPDGVFDEEEKKVILGNIAMFEEQTRHSPLSPAHNKTAVCREKGYSMGLAVMRSVEGGDQQHLTEVAHYMINTWRMDEKCGKQFIVAISLDDGFFSVVAPGDSLMRMDKFSKYFSDSNANFLQSEVRTALKEIFTAAAEDAHSGALFSLFNRKKRAPVVAGSI